MKPGERHALTLPRPEESGQCLNIDGRGVHYREEWISQYFTLEDKDREVLGNPEEHIL
jgi:hypothetical protein